MPEFKTVRQTAKTGLISEHYLRMMIARGECPGLKSGNRFLVNVTALSALLDELSRKGLEVRENG